MPDRRSPACSADESFERDGPGSFVARIGIRQLVELLGNKAAQRHSAMSGHDLCMPDSCLI